MAGRRPCCRSSWPWSVSAWRPGRHGAPGPADPPSLSDPYPVATVRVADLHQAIDLVPHRELPDDPAIAGTTVCLLAEAVDRLANIADNLVTYAPRPWPAELWA